MPIATYNAWLALYTGVGLMVALCAVLAAVKTIYDLRLGLLVLEFSDCKGRFFAVPKLWVALADQLSLRHASHPAEGDPVRASSGICHTR